jgi:hypothetical protein
MRARDEQYLEPFNPEERYVRERASWTNRDQLYIVQWNPFGSAGDAFDFDAIASAEVDGPMRRRGEMI